MSILKFRSTRVLLAYTFHIEWSNGLKSTLEVKAATASGAWMKFAEWATIDRIGSDIYPVYVQLH